MRRYKVIVAKDRFGEKCGYTITDTEHPRIGYPVFEKRREAEEYVAGIYGLTVEEYRNERKNTK